MTRRVDIQLMLILTACILIFGYTLNSTKKTAAITIGFAGDVMIGRLVNEVIGQKGYSYPWGDVLPLLQRTDLNIINLETTLTTSTNRLPKTFNYKASPDRVKTLQEARIDIVNLANNHIRDFGDVGLLETIKTLDAAGIKHVGAGKNIDEAHKQVIITKNNVKIGIIGYTDNEPGWQAQENKSGTNYIKVGDIDKIHRYITPLRDQVDLLIVSIHDCDSKLEFCIEIIRKIGESFSPFISLPSKSAFSNTTPFFFSSVKKISKLVFQELCEPDTDLTNLHSPNGDQKLYGALFLQTRRIPCLVLLMLELKTSSCSISIERYF